MHKKWRGEKIKTIKRIRHDDERGREKLHSFKSYMTELYSREARALHSRK